MKRVYAKSSYAKPYEQYCREKYPNDAEQIFAKAEECYLAFMKDMPDLGKNMMAANMLDWFTILAFSEEFHFVYGTAFDLKQCRRQNEIPRKIC